MEEQSSSELTDPGRKRSLPQPPPTGQGGVPCFASLIYAIPTDPNVSHDHVLGH